MRKIMLVLAGSAAVAVMAGAAVTLSTELVSANARVTSDQVSINRSAKGNRINFSVVTRGAALPEPKAKADAALPEGCEQSVSPLASTSSLRARCVASLPADRKIAAS